MKQTELDLEHLAKLGAQEEIRLLETQINALLKFVGEPPVLRMSPDEPDEPTLLPLTDRMKAEARERDVFTAVAHDRPRRGHHVLTPAQRQAVSRRMRTYWRQRRAAEK